MGDNEEENSNKVIFLGESGVGKTNLIRISTGQEFASQKLPTTNVSSEEKKSITKFFLETQIVIVYMILHANNHLFH